MAVSAGRPELPDLPTEPPLGPVARPPDAWPGLPSTPAAVMPGRPWAALVVAWIGVLIGGVTAFAPWAEYTDGVELTGIEHGDGWFVLALVIVAAALVGALAMGWRHVAVRAGLIGTSVLLFVLFGLNRIDLGRSDDRVTGGPIDAGSGLYGVAVAAFLVLAGALIIPVGPDRSD